MLAGIPPKFSGPWKKTRIIHPHNWAHLVTRSTTDFDGKHQLCITGIRDLTVPTDSTEWIGQVDVAVFACVVCCDSKYYTVNIQQIRTCSTVWMLLIDVFVCIWSLQPDTRTRSTVSLCCAKQDGLFDFRYQLTTPPYLCEIYCQNEMDGPRKQTTCIQRYV